MSNDDHSPSAPPPLPDTPIYSGPEPNRASSPRKSNRVANQERARQIGERIREIRLQRGLSQQDLVDRLGHSSRNWLSAIENGKQLISTALLDEVAQALNISASYLLHGAAPVEESTTSTTASSS